MWEIDNKKLTSRLLLGSAQYPSPDILEQSVKAAKTEVITVSIRRQHNDKKNNFWDILKKLNCYILPNTAGCYSAKDAITTAQMAREIFATNWIKLEVIGDEYTLQPDPFELIKAAERLNQLGFTVFPYMTDDVILAQKLVDAGCQILMPWAAPIGSGKGIINPYALRVLRERFQDKIIIVDAGIGKPSDAAKAMEMGMDAVLLNSAVAGAHDPVNMGRAFYHAVEAGRAGFKAGLIPENDFAKASSPLIGTPFWHAS